MDRRTFTVALACLLLPITAQAQEKYTIKLKEISQGESARIEFKQSSIDKSTTTIEKEKEPKVVESKGTKHLLYTDTILERPAGAKLPTKIKRVYEKAWNEGTGAFAEKDKARPYHGKTLLIERKDSKFEFRIEGGEVVKDDPDLENEFNLREEHVPRKIFVPPGPVALKETWKFDPATFLGGFGKTKGLKVHKFDGVARLVKAYKKDGRLYGLVDAVVNMEIKFVFDNAKPGEEQGTHMKTAFKIAFEGCIDGTVAEGRISATATSNTTGKYRVMAGVPAVTISGNNTITIENTWTAAAQVNARAQPLSMITAGPVALDLLVAISGA